MVDVEIEHLGETILAENRKLKRYREFDAFLEEKQVTPTDPLFYALTDLAEFHTLSGMHYVSDADPRLQVVKLRISISQDRVPRYTQAREDLQEGFLHELLGLEMGFVHPQQLQGAKTKEQAHMKLGKELTRRRTRILQPQRKP